MKKQMGLGGIVLLLIAGLLLGQRLKGQAAVRPEAEIKQNLWAESAELQPLVRQLNEVLALEQQLDAGGGTAGQEEVRLCYQAALVLAITGGWDQSSGRKNAYAGRDGSYIDATTVDYYRDVVGSNKDSRTAVLLSQYIQVLEKSNLQIDDRVMDFYEKLPELAKEWSQAEVGSFSCRMLEWKLWLERR